QAIEAPFLTKDQRVRYDTETRTLVHAESEDEGIHIWTPADQSGLRRAGRGRDDDLNVRDGNLLYSYSNGRVPVIQDPQGRAENVESLATRLEVRSTQMDQAATRLKEVAQSIRKSNL
ncbi:MAG: hypothetical protein ABIB47_00860, partial [Candidatus Woesearchaeota archaeon]